MLLLSCQSFLFSLGRPISFTSVSLKYPSNNFSFLHFPPNPYSFFPSSVSNQFFLPSVRLWTQSKGRQVTRAHWRISPNLCQRLLTARGRPCSSRVYHINRLATMADLVKSCAGFSMYGSFEGQLGSQREKRSEGQRR